MNAQMQQQGGHSLFKPAIEVGGQLDLEWVWNITRHKGDKGQKKRS